MTLKLYSAIIPLDFQIEAPDGLNDTKQKKGLKDENVNIHTNNGFSSVYGFWSRRNKRNYRKHIVFIFKISYNFGG